jgi:hypothetical protein
VEPAQLRHGLAAVGVELSEDDFARLVRIADPEGEGHIDVDDVRDVIFDKSAYVSVCLRRVPREALTLHVWQGRGPQA